MDGNNFNNGYDPNQNAGYGAPQADPNAGYGAPASDPNAGYGAPAGDPNMGYGQAPYGNNTAYTGDVYGAPQGQQPNKTKSILALVFGICAIVLSCCCTYLGIALGVAAIIIAILSKNDSPDGKMSGMALAGLICAIVGIVISVGSIIAVLCGLVDTSWVDDLMKQVQ